MPQIQERRRNHESCYCYGKQIGLSRSRKSRSHAERVRRGLLDADHLRPQNAEAGRRICCQCGSKRIWYHHRSGRKGCSSGRRAGSNHASSGHWTADEIQHHGRSGFPAFCRTDAERRTGSHRSHKRGRKRCDPGSTDPGGRRSGSSPENQGFQEKTGRRNHRVRP